jgi:hypothetical protein
MTDEGACFYKPNIGPIITPTLKVMGKTINALD